MDSRRRSPRGVPTASVLAARDPAVQRQLSTTFSFAYYRIRSYPPLPCLCRPIFARASRGTFSAGVEREQALRLPPLILGVREVGHAQTRRRATAETAIPNCRCGTLTDLSQPTQTYTCSPRRDARTATRSPPPPRTPRPRGVTDAQVLQELLELRHLRRARRRSQPEAET